MRTVHLLKVWLAVWNCTHYTCYFVHLALKLQAHAKHTHTSRLNTVTFQCKTQGIVFVCCIWVPVSIAHSEVRTTRMDEQNCLIVSLTCFVVSPFALVDGFYCLIGKITPANSWSLDVCEPFPIGCWLKWNLICTASLSIPLSCTASLIQSSASAHMSVVQFKIIVQVNEYTWRWNINHWAGAYILSIVVYE